MPVVLRSAALTEPVRLEPDSHPFFTPPDQSGLIWAYAFDGDAAAVALSPAEAQQRLAAPPEQGFVWLHFNLSNAHCLRWLQQHAGLDEQYYEALHEGLASTRIERLEHSLLAVINVIDFDFNFESSDIHTLWIHVSPTFVISARTHPLRSVDTLRQHIRNGDRPQSSTELLRLYRERLPKILGQAGSVTTVDPKDDSRLIIQGAEQ